MKMREQGSSDFSDAVICEIPLKLPSLNEYVAACRANRYTGAKMVKQAEFEIRLFIHSLPKFDYPVNICFIWQEANRKRDFDNIAFAKKFILDALVKEGKLKDDNRRHVTGFVDRFEYGDEWKVKLIIERSKT